jgi:hypothetical protein
MDAIRLAVGGPLAFSWLSCMLFGLEIYGYVEYFRRFPKDSLFIRSCVIATAVFSTGHQVNEFAYCFHAGVITWGK